MNEFIGIIFGDFTLLELFGYMWFFVIGYIIYGLTETSGRDIKSIRTPRKWSWKFWFLDNWRRYLTTILCTYILFMFYTEISGHPFSNFDAVTLGLIGDGIGATIKNRVKGISADREQIMRNYDEDELG
jgi:hypothetical protein